MNSYEDQLDEIRIKLFEETNGMEKSEIIKLVNSHAGEIAKTFGIAMTKETGTKPHRPWRSFVSEFARSANST